ncbi:MAG: YfhO family protein [Atopococcus tabaci]|uniref:YfhO family protein n=1 Tax=Atopococcus tabaci TaxID=269774 RepID=A0AA43RJM0_9LACT|nr:YfhO family protein [Atopococcus tabaci]
MKEILYKYRYSLTTFFLPILILTIIFISMGVFPFGDKTLFTIDLGQQYVDFYAEYKHTWSGHLERLIYSFNKGIGGEMTGIWAYYLMSPLNLIFLITPFRYLDLAVTLLILIRYGLAGWSMGYYLKNMQASSLSRLLVFSTSYALSGYMVNYQFNLMWMDGFILLPLICLGVERILQGKSPLLYTVTLALCLISNYYIAFMVCLFMILYFFYRLTSYITRENWKKQSIQLISRFAGYSILAAGISAFILIPTFVQLMQSKAAASNFSWDFSAKFPLMDLVSKFTIGAFNFDQFPDGLPNIFVSALILIQVLRYFFNSSFKWQEKTASALFILILTLSFNLEVINKIWHGFQNPNWFPYRYSFVFIFLLIYIAYRQSAHQSQLTLQELLHGAGLSVLISIYLMSQDFDYLSSYKILFTLLLIVLYFIVLIFYSNKVLLRSLLLLSLVTLELTGNASLSLNELNYVDRSRFIEAQSILTEMTETIHEHDNPSDSFYRIEKTFQRTKNDSHQVNFKSASHFGSTYEAHSYEGFTGLGFPGGSGYSAYSNGTLLTDALFSIKYYAADNEINVYEHTPYYNTNADQALPMSIIQSKADLVHYDPLFFTDQYTIYRNPYALPLGLKVNDDLMDLDLVNNHPMFYQNQLARSFSPEHNPTELFKPVEADQTYENIEIEDHGRERLAKVNNPEQPAYIRASLTAEEDMSYYYILNGFNTWDNFEIKVNGQPQYQYNTFYHDVVVNLEADKNDRIELEIEVTADDFYLSRSGFYQMAIDDFEGIITQAKNNSIEIENYTDSSLSFQTQITDSQEMVMLTIPYDDSWQITANGEEISAHPVMDSFLGLKLSEGNYTIEMNYRTPYGKISWLISLMSIFILFIINKYPVSGLSKNKK